MNHLNQEYHHRRMLPVPLFPLPGPQLSSSSATPVSCCRKCTCSARGQQDKQFECTHSLMPNYLKWTQLYSIFWVSNVILDGRANTAAMIVHTQTQFVYILLIWTWSISLFQGISDFMLAIDQSHSAAVSAWQLLALTLNAALKSCNVTHLGL